MRTFLSAAIACFLFVATSVPATAGSIVGTIGFNIAGNATDAANSLAPAITFTNVKTNNTGTQDWSAFTSASYPGGLLAMDQLAINTWNSTGQSLSFSNAGFGSFTGTILSDTITTLPTSMFTLSTRWLQVTGTFSPGTTLNGAGYMNTVAAQVSIFYQGYIAGSAPLGSRSGTVVMSTIPEPASIAMLAAGSASLFGLLRRRRQKM